MRLTRCALVAAMVAASASAFGLPLFFMDRMSHGSDATRVRMVSSSGTSQSRAESSWPLSTNPGPQESVRPCHSYGGPYCGWVEIYWGGCDREWGLSFGIKNPGRICPHDLRASSSATSDSTESSGSS
ncbi:hypothetical protein ACFU7Y_02045 [Kitasatospora sp. NPDC057542]|uniref:hypothetical protein n=1 Tax=Streptomycetaceae TaxID=2062 RepID=UPI001CCC7E76|nr:hypothetical protein [Streptomyces sp. LS1784]